jgi:hypothetical protein
MHPNIKAQCDSFIEYCRTEYQEKFMGKITHGPITVTGAAIQNFSGDPLDLAAYVESNLPTVIDGLSTTTVEMNGHKRLVARLFF